MHSSDSEGGPSTVHGRYPTECQARAVHITVCIPSAQAEQSGILRAQYANEWAAYLEANDCTYQDLVC